MLAKFYCYRVGSEVKHYLACENDKRMLYLQKSGEDVMASRSVPDIVQDKRVDQGLGEEQERGDQEEWKEEEEEEGWEKEAYELYQWSQELSFDDIR